MNEKNTELVHKSQMIQMNSDSKMVQLDLKFNTRDTKGINYNVLKAIISNIVRSP